MAEAPHATGDERYFVDDTDRIGWIRLLARVLDVNGWTCYARSGV
jgi:hypothetical protein